MKSHFIAWLSLGICLVEVLAAEITTSRMVLRTPLLELEFTGPLQGDQIRKLHMPVEHWQQEIRYHWVRQMEKDWQCPDDVATLASAAWVPYAKASPAEKKKFLERKLVGIGHRYAKILAADPEFAKLEPRAWSALLRELEGAEARNPALAGVYARVKASAKQVQDNLAYSVRPHPSCSWEVVGYFNYRQPTLSEILKHRSSVVLVVELSGLHLLAKEQQRLEIQWEDRELDDIWLLQNTTAEPSLHELRNYDWQESERGLEIKMEFARKKVLPRISAVKIDVERRGFDQWYLQLQDLDLSDWGEAAGELQVELRLRENRRWPIWQAYPILWQGVLSFAPGQEFLQYQPPISLVGKTFFVEYRLRRIGSQVYLDRWSLRQKGPVQHFQ